MLQLKNESNKTADKQFSRLEIFIRNWNSSASTISRNDPKLAFWLSVICPSCVYPIRVICLFNLSTQFYSNLSNFSDCRFASIF